MCTRIFCQTLLMMTLAFGSLGSGAQMPQFIMNARDLRSALKTAKTPEDHVRIAAYCSAKADSLDAEAAANEQAAEASRNSPVIKNIMALNTAARYDSVAKRLRKEAQSYRNLAARQQQLAETAE